MCDAKRRKGRDFNKRYGFERTVRQSRREFGPVADYGTATNKKIVNMSHERLGVFTLCECLHHEGLILA